jgi:hypothetical protein
MCFAKNDSRFSPGNALRQRQDDMDSAMEELRRQSRPRQIQPDAPADAPAKKPTKAPLPGGVRG